MISAMVFDGPDRPLRSSTFSRPVLGSGAALVRNHLCTLCGSDLHTFFGRRREPVPTVLGHEAVGVIEELGPGGLVDVDGARVEIGDRVVWAVAGSCGTCFFCTHDLPQKCESLFKYGHQVVTPDRGPLGGLATHCHLLPGTAVVKVPDAVPDELAAPAACATATVAAAMRAGGDVRDGVVLVLGAGLLGLTTCAMARANGAGEVVAADTDSRRLELASQFGATRTVLLSLDREELVDRLASLTAGRGADVVFEMTGAPPAVELGLARARVGGTVVLVGSVSPVGSIEVHPDQIVRRCLRIVGVHNYAPPDLSAAVRFLAANASRFPFADLVTRRFSLADAEAGFHFAETERPVRVAVVTN
ncbi:zinc-binding dehydrogenase [Fimbriiglobus ruber]|uniref:Threonine dehydrogenase n=1 Tax=Fimbriiglobus ruber TaxID=1908690 RepID=A0A225CZV6_9BACT|nr:zinc-binding dehydrogenase [Fimbriiglobus ruber]OWK34890.1 Threonine dehydrogenase [Fimbriiglobus ruber]